jgi:hypothetical protein
VETLLYRVKTTPLNFILLNSTSSSLERFNSPYGNTLDCIWRELYGQSTIGVNRIHSVRTDSSRLKFTRLIDKLQNFLVRLVIV